MKEVADSPPPRMAAPPPILFLGKPVIEETHAFICQTLELKDWDVP
jgi:hypothetical protein